MKSSSNRISVHYIVHPILIAAVMVAMLCLQTGSYASSAPLGYGGVAHWSTTNTSSAALADDDLLGAWARMESGKFLRDVVTRSGRPETGTWDVDAIDETMDEETYFSPGTGQESGQETLAIPQLEGGLERMLEPDASLTLRFDRPIGKLRVSGPLPLVVETNIAHQVFRLVPRTFAQGQTYPVQVYWTSFSGVPLPPLNLQVSTPPPLAVKVTPQGIDNLGLVLPLQLTFSEPLADRRRAKEQISVRTVDGQDIQGSWAWIGKSRLQFTPKPAWPASSTIQVRIEAAALKTQRGGRLEEPVLGSFNTGTDRRIFVYLDTQRVTAVENGQVIRSFRVSTGKPKTPTATGNFYIYDRYSYKTMRSRGIPKGHPGYYLVEDVPYTQFFHGDMAFHGAFWHNNFGRTASHGCVNMSTREKNKRWPNVPEDAGWLYGWASLGVPVTVFKDTPVEMATK